VSNVKGLLSAGDTTVIDMLLLDQQLQTTEDQICTANLANFERLAAFDYIKLDFSPQASADAVH
jgi:hypothetical protein